MKRSRLRSATTAAIVLMAFAGGAAAQAPKGADPSAVEILFWETIRNSTNPADFEEYLKQYPDGKFAGLARIRVRAAAPAPLAAPMPSTGTAPGPSKASLASTAVAFALPQAGASWKYRYTDKKYSIGGKHIFDVQLDRTDGLVLHERFAPETGTSADARVAAIASEALTFTSRALPSSRTLVEFSPYLSLPDPRLKTPLRMKSGSGYPSGGIAATGDWQVTMTVLPDAPVTVPAGTFQASRVEVKGVRTAPAATYVTRFQITIWYAPEVKRYVRLDHRTWNSSSALSADEIVELVQFSGT
jgi:hypothetical protein